MGWEEGPTFLRGTTDQPHLEPPAPPLPLPPLLLFLSMSTQEAGPCLPRACLSALLLHSGWCEACLLRPLIPQE